VPPLLPLRNQRVVLTASFEIPALPRRTVSSVQVDPVSLPPTPWSVRRPRHLSSAQGFGLTPRLRSGPFYPGVGGPPTEPSATGRHPARR
jgi:hypothetical protein